VGRVLVDVCVVRETRRVYACGREGFVWCIMAGFGFECSFRYSFSCSFGVPLCAFLGKRILKRVRVASMREPLVCTNSRASVIQRKEIGN
jgi:hypothetical protein